MLDYGVEVSFRFPNRIWLLLTCSDMAVEGAKVL